MWGKVDVLKIVEQTFIELNIYEFLLKYRLHKFKKPLPQIFT